MLVRLLEGVGSEPRNNKAPRLSQQFAEEPGRGGLAIALAFAPFSLEVGPFKPIKGDCGSAQGQLPSRATRLDKFGALGAGADQCEYFGR